VRQHRCEVRSHAPTVSIQVAGERIVAAGAAHVHHDEIVPRVRGAECVGHVVVGARRRHSGAAVQEDDRLQLPQGIGRRQNENREVNRSAGRNAAVFRE
jgi:hypothetical protein